MKIVYFGNGARGKICLESLFQNSYSIHGVVVHHQTPEQSRHNSIRSLAEQNSVPVFDPRSVNDAVFVKILQDIQPDLLILSGYNQILKGEILSVPRLGSINLHGGRLPFYRGGSPINWQIIQGETTGGCAVLYVDEGIDTGEILAQELYSIGPDETAGEVIERTLDIFPRLLLHVLNQIQRSEAVPVRQDPRAGAYYCKRYPWEGRIDWTAMTAVQVHNLVRGLNGPGLPGAFTFLQDKKITIWETKLLEYPYMGKAGRIALKQEQGVIVIAADRGLLVKSIRNNHGDIVPAANAFSVRGDFFE